MNITRYTKKQIQNNIKPKQIALILGARRVGKTTLIKNIISETSEKVKFINCDDPDIRDKLSNIGLNSLKRFLKNSSIIVFDEAQRIKNIGITLKMIVDEIPNKKLIVTGSSSLELSNQVKEPLTGRKKTFQLHPISFLELYHHLKKDQIATQSHLSDILKFGSYPKIFHFDQNIDKQEYLLELSSDYLYQDVLEYQSIKNPEQLRKLLQALALQIGNEVSYTELASLIGLDQKTIVKYIDLLEKSFVIFKLPAFSRNLRTEISKSRKIYFYDLGIRNALIKNFNHYDIRNDLGGIWENFLISERIKHDLYQRTHKNYYFWRTYDQKEIDLVEEYGGKITAFEFKFRKDKFKKPVQFLKTYPNSTIQLINKDNFLTFIT